MIEINLAKPKRKKNLKLLREIKTQPCAACARLPGDPWNPIDPAHIRSKGSGGDDVPENVIPLCRKHHSSQHCLGFVRMMKTYPMLRWALEAKGWTVVDGKLFHPVISVRR